MERAVEWCLGVRGVVEERGEGWIVADISMMGVFGGMVSRVMNCDDGRGED